MFISQQAEIMLQQQADIMLQSDLVERNRSRPNMDLTMDAYRLAAQEWLNKAPLLAVPVRVGRLFYTGKQVRQITPGALCSAFLLVKYLIEKGVSSCVFQITKRMGSIRNQPLIKRKTLCYSML